MRGGGVGGVEVAFCMYDVAHSCALPVHLHFCSAYPAAERVRKAGSLISDRLLHTPVVCAGGFILVCLYA